MSLKKEKVNRMLCQSTTILMMAVIANSGHIIFANEASALDTNQVYEENTKQEKPNEIMESQVVTADSNREKSKSMESPSTNANKKVEPSEILSPDNSLTSESIKNTSIGENETVNESLIDQAKSIHEKINPVEGVKKLDGRGVLIASVDSGVDVNHEAMSLDKDIADKDLKEKTIEPTFTRKVPFGFDFLSGDGSIKDPGTEHGMHIAGVLVGNKKDGFKGMAPNAQLLAYRNWSESSSEGYVEDHQFFALADAIKRKADVISLSIGEEGTGQKDDIWYDILRRAAQKDIIVAAAMGNYGTSNMTTTFDKVVDEKYPLTDNSTLLAVSANPNVIGVGSYYEPHIYLPHLKIDHLDIPYENVNWENYYIFKQKEQDVYEEINQIVDFSKMTQKSDLKDKVVLVKRNDQSVFKQLSEVMQYPVKGIILVNGPTSKTLGNFREFPEMRSTLLDDNKGLFKKTWAISISENDGRKLQAYLEKKKDKKILRLHTKPVKTKLIDYPIVSGFSTWGATPDLRMKPDLIAPGENVYSTGSGNSYFNDSGTSMAAPHAAGASALLLPLTKLIQKEWEKQENQPISLIQLNKIILQNSASVLKDVTVPAGKPILEYSPRRQGAGAINLKRALKNRVFVTSTENEGAINLKDFKAKTKTFNIIIRNLSDKDQYYSVQSGNVLGNITYDNKRLLNDKTIDIKTVHSRAVEGAKVTTPEFIKIAAKSKMIIPLALEVGQAIENEFLEGYLYFKSLDGQSSDLNIPYMGFYGDWNKENIVDPPSWDKDSKTKMTGFVKGYPLGEDSFNYLPLGTNYDNWKKDHSAIESNPNYSVFQSHGGIDNQSVMRLRLTFLRNAKDYIVEIVDTKEADANVLKVLKVGHYYPKYMESALKEDPSMYSPIYEDYEDDLEWKGQFYDPKSDLSKPAKDGNYYIRVRARIDDTRSWQTSYIPFSIDNDSPKVSLLNKENDSHYFSVKDPHLHNVILKDKNGKEIETLQVNKENLYKVSLSKYKGQDIYLYAYDYAENVTIFDINNEQIIEEKQNGQKVTPKTKTRKKALSYSIQTDDNQSKKAGANDDDFDASDEEEENESTSQTFENGSDFSDGKQTWAYTEGTIAKSVGKEDDNTGQKYRDYKLHLKKGQYAVITNTNALYNASLEKPLTQTVWSNRYDYDEAYFKENHFRHIEVPIYEGTNIINLKVYSDGKEIFNKGYSVKLDTKVPELTFHNKNISFEKEDWQNELDSDSILGTITIPGNTLTLSGMIRDAQDGWKLFVNENMVDSVMKPGEYDDFFKTNQKEWFYETKVNDGDHIRIRVEDKLQNSKSYLFKVKIVKDMKSPVIKNAMTLTRAKVKDLELINDLNIPEVSSVLQAMSFQNEEDLFKKLTELLPQFNLQIIHLNKTKDRSSTPKKSQLSEAYIRVQKNGHFKDLILRWGETNRPKQNTKSPTKLFEAQGNHKAPLVTHKDQWNMNLPGKSERIGYQHGDHPIKNTIDSKQLLTSQENTRKKVSVNNRFMNSGEAKVTKGMETKQLPPLNDTNQSTSLLISILTILSSSLFFFRKPSKNKWD